VRLLIGALAASAVLALTVACGGGGASSTPSPSPSPTATCPTAAELFAKYEAAGEPSGGAWFSEQTIACTNDQLDQLMSDIDKIASPSP
jgi:hypothetical protein